MSVTKEQAAASMRRVILAIVQIIEECGPQGTPSGVLYAALMTYGMSLEVFEGIMGAIVRAGIATKRGHCYYPVSK